MWFKNRAELWGVTSAGNSHCGTKNSPGLYTNVADHLQWVENALAGNYEKPEYDEFDIL